MPIVTVTEPYLTVWLEDVPLTYKTAYGPPVEVRLAYHDRDIPSLVSSSYWHGAEFGNYQGVEGLWSCSLLSFAELSTDGYTVDLMLPGRGWAAFTFASGATNSSINYQNNVWLEKQGPGAGTSSSAVTNLILHYSNGSQISYGVKDTNYTDFAAVFYMTGQADSMGVSTSFA